MLQYYYEVNRLLEFMVSYDDFVKKNCLSKHLSECFRRILRECKFPKFSEGGMPPDPPIVAVG